jgi:Protein of unknown function (DUF3237)
MPPELAHVFTTRLQLAPDRMHALGPQKGASGPSRFIVEFASGYMSSVPSCPHNLHPLHFAILNGFDALSLDTTLYISHIDTRGTMKIAKGELVYMRYEGVVRVDEASTHMLHWSKEAKTTESRDHYWMVTPRYKVSSDRLKWTEESVFIGHAHWHIPGDGTQFVEYEVYLAESA